MDIGSLSTAAMLASSQSRAQAVAINIIKNSAESQQAVANLLQESQENLATLADKISTSGHVLDITV